MTSAISTHPNDIKERLSVGHVATVAARAGCMIIEMPVDRQSIDVTIRPVDGESVSIDAQLKATAGLRRSKGMIVYDLPRKNYDNLRQTLTQAPKILVVLDLHKDDLHWLACRPTSSVLKRSAYWVDLTGLPPVTNETTVRIKIPPANVLTPAVIVDLMDRRLKNLKLFKPGFAP
jgi:hypothetical protein